MSNKALYIMAGYDDDNPDTIYKALPLVMNEFSAFDGKVTSLHLYEFFPTRHILSVDFE